MAVFLFLLGTKIKNLICIKKMAVIFYFGLRQKTIYPNIPFSYVWDKRNYPNIPYFLQCVSKQSLFDHQPDFCPV